MRNFGLVKFLVLSGVTASLGGCPSSEAPDARPMQVFDGGGTIDSGTPVIDGAPPPPAVSGTVSIQSVKVAGHPEFGEGHQVSISFTPPATFPANCGGPAPEAACTAPGFVYFHDEGSLLAGCTSYVINAPALPSTDTNQGNIAITTTGSTVFPTCAFDSGRGEYECKGPAGTGDVLAAGVLTDTGGFSAADTGRYVRITGGGGTNAGTFPIIAATADTLTFGNPASTLENGLTYQVIAGGGPVPTLADPMGNADVYTVALTPGGDQNVGAFSSTPALINTTTGDTFVLDTTGTNANPENISVSGTGFTFACTSGCTNADSAGFIVTIETTNVNVGAIPLPVFPTSTATRTASIQCRALGATTAVIPDSAAFALSVSQATRIRTTILRDNLAQSTPPTGTPPNKPNIVIGHGIVGFTDI